MRCCMSIIPQFKEKNMTKVRLQSYLQRQKTQHLDWAETVSGTTPKICGARNSSTNGLAGCYVLCLKVTTQALPKVRSPSRLGCPHLGGLRSFPGDAGLRTSTSLWSLDKPTAPSREGPAQRHGGDRPRQAPQVPSAMF